MMLKCQNAKQLFKIIKRLKRYRPKAAWWRLFIELRPKVILLENVMGFKPVLAKVMGLIGQNVPGFLGQSISIGCSHWRRYEMTSHVVSPFPWLRYQELQSSQAQPRSTAEQAADLYYDDPQGLHERPGG